MVNEGARGGPGVGGSIPLGGRLNVSREMKRSRTVKNVQAS